MSYGSGPPVAPPPPPTKRRSSWSSWWKPVKGTSASGRYSYYESDDDANSRPGSKSGSRPSSRSSWRERFSLSFGDDKKADAVRKEVVESNEVPSTARKLVKVNVENGSGRNEAKNSNRKSTSRPPPAFYNRPFHQRMVSDSALVLQRPTPSHDDWTAQLKAPPTLPTQEQRATPQGWSTGSSTPLRTSRPPPALSIPHLPAPTPSNQHSPVLLDLPLAASQERPGQDKRISRTKASVALQAPTVDPMMAVEGMPGLAGRPNMENRSRRGSSSTVASYNSALSSQESFEGRMRSSSWGSQTSFESAGSPPQKTLAAARLSYTNYQIQNTGQNAAAWRQTQRPPPIKPFRKKAKPGELFAALPGEVLELILEELKKLHIQPGSTSCATCWMRDCCAVALSARKWLKYARVSLYEDIQLTGAEGTVLKKRYKINHNARLVLLRRTLRNVPHIAVMVRSLKVPNMLPPGITLEDYHSLVASVIMACPNLERLAGFFPKYDHDFSRVFHALSTRQRLKAMNWIVDPSPYQRQHRIRPSANNNHIAPGDLQPHQSRAFLDHHVNWSHLTHLTVHCQPGATLTPDTLLTDILRRLPALQTLHLSNLPYTSFNDTNLLALPPLKHLTLSHLPGVTTAGLSSFATRNSTTSITSLTLIHINIDSLPALARIFSNLKSLQTFNLVQSYPPAMPPDEFIMLFPYLASPSLTKLHWDIPYLPTRASVADTILSRSISANGFPALRTLRAPNDPEGVFQSLCRPRERVDEPADRYRFPRSSTVNQSHSRMGSRSSSFDRRTGRSPPASPGFAPHSDSVMFLPRENSDLHSARLAAQGRLEAAKRFPRFFVNVVGVDGSVVVKHGVGAFVGTVGSRIRYCLMPDAGATDEGGGLVGVKELLADNGEEVTVMGAGKGKDRDRSRSRDRGGEADGGVKVREGCSGKWNMRDVVAVDKKERERLWHTERGRWRGVVLS